MSLATPPILTDVHKAEVVALEAKLLDDFTNYGGSFVPSVFGIIVDLQVGSFQDLLIPVPTGECDGRVTSLTLKYLGEDHVQVTVFQNKGSVKEVFDDPVSPGEEFTFSGTWKPNTLGTEIKIYINNELAACIHTSCSEEIGPGTICPSPDDVGLFEVVAGTSRNGGLLLPVDSDDINDACGDCKSNGANGASSRGGKKLAPGKSGTLSTLWGELKTK